MSARVPKQADPLYRTAEQLIEAEGRGRRLAWAQTDIIKLLDVCKAIRRDGGHHSTALRAAASRRAACILSTVDTECSSDCPLPVADIEELLATDTGNITVYQR